MKKLCSIFVKINFFMKKIKFQPLFLLFLIFLSCNKKVHKKDFTLKGIVFGTTYKITYLNAEKNFKKELDSLFFEFNNSLSTYIPNSDISKINKGDDTILVDDYFAEVFKKSKVIYKITNGFFDPTVGNLVNAYGFGPDKGSVVLSKAALKEQMQFVGFDKVTLENNKIKKEYPQIYLDFNSIAKGFGIDVVARFFDEKNIENYLIEIGGEIRAKGTKKGGEPWLIKVVDPLKSNENGGYKLINLSNKSMATSGNYRKFRIDSLGKKFVHTVNPKTGLAQESNLLSASVIAVSDCADVDAYATAFMAMGLEKTKEIIKNNSSLKVILLYFDKDGNMNEYSNYKEK